jgi:hypothetical protein
VQLSAITNTSTVTLGKAQTLCARTEDTAPLMLFSSLCAGIKTAILVPAVCGMSVECVGIWSDIVITSLSRNDLPKYNHITFSALNLLAEAHKVKKVA